MSKIVMLKWARREKHLTQTQVAEAVGISDRMISKLELDHKAWNELTEEEIIKLNDFFDGTKYWEHVEFEPEVSEPEEIIETVIDESNADSCITDQIQNDDSLDETDIKALTLIEFVYEGLNESKTHDEFVSNMKILERILKKYE